MRYRLIAPTGQVLEEGEGAARVDGGALVVTPALGQPLRIRPIDVTAVTEPAPYVVQLRLTEGPGLELSQLGALRTQVLSDFATVRAEATVDTLLLAGVGTPTVYPGAVNEVESEIRLYDDALVTIPVSGDPQQVRFAAIEDIATDASGYRITVRSTGQPPLDLHRLAARTTEFLGEFRRRVNNARVRSAALVSALLPGLPSLATRSVAGLLRDGVPARATDLDAIEPTVSAALVRVATLPERLPCVAALAQRGEIWLALHQRRSVEVAATGGGDLSARPVQVNVDHGGVPTAPGGLAGVAMGSVLAGGPDFFNTGNPVVDIAVLGGFGGFGGFLSSTASGAPDRHMPRSVPESHPADVRHTDYAALGTSGADPAVLGMVFALLPAHGAVVYEELNEPDHATYVYDLPGGDAAAGVQLIAAAMASLRFRVSAIYADASGADSAFRDAVARLPQLAWLRDGFRGRVIHTEGWEAQLDGLLARKRS